MLALSLILGSALAGCMGGPGDGGGDSALTSEEARNEIQTALSTLQNSTSEFGKKVSVNVTYTNDTADPPTKGYMEMYLDAELDEVIFRMAGQGFSGGGSGGSSPGYLLVARMGKTAIFGADDQLLAAYNDSAEDITAFKSLSQLNPGAPGTGDSDPTFLFDAIQQNLTKDVETFTAKQITYQGKKALEIKSAGTSEESASLRFVIWTEPQRRIALIEGRVSEEAAENSDNLQAPGHIKITFQYGSDASMDMRDDLVRVESMAYLEQGDTSPRGQSGRWTNHTIQPSRDLPAGEVALDEVVAHVTNRAFGGSSEVVLNMTLSQGTAESDEVRLTYEDVDGNSMVSEGDEIRMERLDENATLSLQLEDTVTGLKVSPSATALGALAAAGAAALLARRD